MLIKKGNYLHFRSLVINPKVMEIIYTQGVFQIDPPIINADHCMASKVDIYGNKRIYVATSQLSELSIKLVFEQDWDEVEYKEYPITLGKNKYSLDTGEDFVLSHQGSGPTIKQYLKLGSLPAYEYQDQAYGSFYAAKYDTSYYQDQDYDLQILFSKDPDVYTVKGSYKGLKAELSCSPTINDTPSSMNYKVTQMKKQIVHELSTTAAQLKL